MAQSQIVDGCQRRFTFGELGAANCGDPESGCLGKVLSTPAEESPGGSDLGTRQRLCFMLTFLYRTSGTWGKSHENRREACPLLVDLRNIYSSDEMERYGFLYVGI
jgi:hypothetical protein